MIFIYMFMVKAVGVNAIRMLYFRFVGTGAD